MISSSPKPTTAIMEDYLKAIFEIGLDNKVVRVRDIAARMNVKMPAVTGMLKKLDHLNLVDYEKYGYVELKPEGREIAMEMHRRHNLLTVFLTTVLGVADKVAVEEACRMEHALSRSTLERLSRLVAAFRSGRSVKGEGIFFELNI